MKNLEQFENLNENKESVNEDFTVDIGGGIETTNPFYDESGRQYSEKLSLKSMKALKGTELGRAVLAFEDIVDEYMDWKQSAPSGEDEDYLNNRLPGLKLAIKYLNSIVK